MNRALLHRALCLCLLVFIESSLVGPLVATEPADSPSLVFVQLPIGDNLVGPSVEAGGVLRSSYGDGGRIVLRTPDGKLKVLTAGFVSACELDVSFDGQRILFAGKRQPADPWSIWELEVDGGEPRRITTGADNCRSPAYQSTLYTIVSSEPWYQIMFSSDAAGVRSDSGWRSSTDLYSCKLDGGSRRRITFNLSHDFDPFLMPDGRVLLSSWQRMGLRRGEAGRVSLFGVNSDGVDYALLCGDPGRRVKHMACVTTTGLVVFVEGDTVERDGSGSLATVTLRRPNHSYRSLTTAESGFFHSPSPLDDGSILVARRPRDGSGNHGIYRLDPAAGESQLIFDDPQWHDLHGRQLKPRSRPDGRSSSVMEKYPSKLYCLNAHLTDPRWQAQWKPGAVREIRVLEGVPVANGHDPRSASLVPVTHKRVLGLVPVEADGSFQVEIPPNTPIQLQVLDESGMALRSCGWIWAKPREARGCIGCHEDPDLTPENRFVEALKKPAPKLVQPVESRRVVSFPDEVLPVLQAKCGSGDCHGGGDRPLRLAGDPEGLFERGYVSLLDGFDPTSHPDNGLCGKYVIPGQARSSPLIWQLLGHDTTRPWDRSAVSPAGTCALPPEQLSTLLSPVELLTLIEWIDLGAHYHEVPRQIAFDKKADAEKKPEADR